MCLKAYRIKWLTKKLIPMQQQRMNHQVPDEAIQKEIEIYHKLYQLNTELIGNKKFPHSLFMAREALRIAAQLHDAQAQFLLGKLFLDEAKWREQLEHEKLFSSEGNQRLMKEFYESAHAYLTSADKSGHILGKRYHGLCYIFGWGVTQDKDKGFSMVVDSIAKENSWQKASEIFAAHGLNTPEFFEAFVKHQGKQQH